MDLKGFIYNKISTKHPYNNFDEGDYWELAEDMSENAGHPAWRHIGHEDKIELIEWEHDCHFSPEDGCDFIGHKLL